MTASPFRLGRYVRTDGSLSFEARCPHGVLAEWVARQTSRRVGDDTTSTVPTCECPGGERGEAA